MRILFISFYFPPVKAVATVRTWNICKCLLAAGHTVQVVTIDENDMPKERLESVSGFDEIKSSTTYSELRVSSPWPALYGCGTRSGPGRGGLLLWLEMLFSRVFSKITIWAGFDPMLPWAFAVWRRIRAKTDIDLVLVSGGPFSSFLPGYYLSRTLVCPLVLDYRDVWNNSPHTKVRVSTRAIERRILHHARLVTSVSPSCLTTILGSEMRPSAVITNGVSDHAFQYRCYHLQKPDSIVVYAGALYPPKRSIAPFLNALVKFREKRGDRDEIRFIYLGPTGNYVQKTAKLCGLNGMVECRGMVPHEEALRMQAKALVTLIITTVDESANEADKGILTGKLFEAIALSRNVLVISPVNSDARKLTAGIPHVYNFTGVQHEAMAQWLEKIVDTPFIPDSSRPRYFSWRALGENFARHVYEQGNS